MARIVAVHLHAMDLPFRGKFEHAASSRETSSSLMLEIELEDGTTGWGEALPRSYVTDETRDSACEILRDRILPRLIGRDFANVDEVISFLTDCDGRAPGDWVPKETPQSAAWCAVDLALLDAFGKRDGRMPFGTEEPRLSREFHYSGVLSSGRNLKRRAQLLAYRLLGFRALKLKIDASTTAREIAAIRRMAGHKVALRADVNMGWNVEQAIERMPLLAREGIASFEQPLPADDLDGAARLVRETGLDVMADESLNTRQSLEQLVETRACTAINARISKCGGLIATLARCREALAAGLWVQIGCQVGESSILSAAHLHLCAAFPEVRHAEGCFGKLLLAEDPVVPLVQMRRGGRPPRLACAGGLGVTVEKERLVRHRADHWKITGP